MKCKTCGHKLEKHTPQCTAVRAGPGWVSFCKCQRFDSGENQEQMKARF
jgi:hypothetical protein